ncbi:hypothetical protein [Pseudoalteromonas citrea]|nr:hypothetical protein [Pseudoalteromonas citrea]
MDPDLRQGDECVGLDVMLACLVGMDPDFRQGDECGGMGVVKCDLVLLWL